MKRRLREACVWALLGGCWGGVGLAMVATAGDQQARDTRTVGLDPGRAEDQPDAGEGHASIMGD